MITDLEPYPAYKNSGVEWLREVPKSWSVLPLSTGFRSVLQRNRGMVERTVLSLSYGQIVTKPDDKLHGLVPESFETYQCIFPGDIIVRTTDLQNDQTSLRVAAVKTKGIITSAYLRLIARENLMPEFGYLVLHAYDVMKIIYGYGSGLRQTLDFAHLKRIPIAIPSIPEQVAIAKFLDYVDSRIQRSITTQERLIVLLNEEKKALIDQIVARGVDPGVPFKPSGIDLLGDIPASWGVCRLKRLASRITSGSRGWSTFAADDGPRFVRIANLKRGSTGLDWGDTMHLGLPTDVIEGEGRRTQIMPGDLLLSITAYIGSVAVAPADIGPAYVSQHVALCRLLTGVNPYWVGYVLLSSLGQNQGRLAMYGGTKQGLSLEDVGNYLILTPPLEEQADLVGRMDKALMKLEQLIEGRRVAVALLREYRTRLMSDIVTGKLDVREAAANLPDDPDADDPTLDEQLEKVVAG